MSTAYSDLVNVSSFGKKRENTFSAERGDVAFYCMDCRKVVDAVRLEPKKVGKRMKEYLYQCPVCQGERISIGTLEGLREHYDRKRV